jgi:ABC-type nitrate/sulfonate/bicarbonate transport system substrate-binding protein
MIKTDYKQNLILVIVFLVFGIGFCISFYFLIIMPQSSRKTEQTDYSQYKSYQFSKDKKVIDFGVQPFWVPTSSITVLMENDEILKADLDRLGYSLKIHAFLKGDDVNHFIKTGDLELGVGGDMPTIRAVLDNDFQAISLMQKGFVSIVSRDILEVKNLKGKKIAYPYGSNAHYYLFKTLKENQISLFDVKFESMNIIDMSEALRREEVDAFVAWEPISALVLNKYPAYHSTARGITYGFLYIKDELVQKNPEVVRVVLASQIRVLNWLKRSSANLLQASNLDSARSLGLSSEYYYVDPEIINRIAKDDLLGLLAEKYPKIDYELLNKGGILAKELLFLQELGFVNKKYTIENLRKKFNFDLIETVIAQPQKYNLFYDFNL